MSDISVRVNDLGKQYRIGAMQDRDTRLGEVITKAMVSPVTEIRKLWTPVPENELMWALRHIEIEAREGETIGIIGRNGAGKSTLLKILARITNPTEGRAELYGRVGALLEVGTGFHTELTGRENIYLKGAMLGMKRQEIDRKLDEIVAFSEIENFVDTPVKRFSSGMGMRLAFAISAHLDAEIMIVDEVLAVGDVAFQNKCLGKMGEVTQTGRTVLFVSHNMGAISRLCERCVWLEGGHVVSDGETRDVVAQYMASSTEIEGERIWAEGFSRPDVYDFKLMAVRTLSQETGTVASTFRIDRPFIIEAEFEVLKRLPYCRIGFEVENHTGVVVFQTFDVDNTANIGEVAPGRYVSRCVVPGPLLNIGQYFLSVTADMPSRRWLARAEQVLSFELIDVNSEASRMVRKRNGLISANFDWTRTLTEPVPAGADPARSA